MKRTMIQKRTRQLFLPAVLGGLLCAANIHAQAPRPATPTGGAASVKSMAIAGFAPTMTFNAGVSNSIKLLLKGNVLSSVIGSGTNGQSLSLLLCQDAAGSRTINWPTNVRLANGGMALTKTPNKCDSVTLVFDGFNWYETSRAMNFNP